MVGLNRRVMHKVMYTILLLISTLSFCQETDIEISKSEVFKNLLNLHNIASEEKHNIDYYSVQIYNGNYKDADSIYNFCQPLRFNYFTISNLTILSNINFISSK